MYFIETRFLLNNIVITNCYRFFFRFPTQDFLTHMETSLLPLKGCKFWRIFDTPDHWAVRILWFTATRDIRILSYCHIRRSVTIHTYFQKFSSGDVTTCRGWDSNTQPSACNANALTVYAIAAAHICYIAKTQSWTKRCVLTCTM